MGHKLQPPGLGFADRFLIENSSTIRDLLSHKRAQYQTFDTADTIVWDSILSKTMRGYPIPIRVVYLEELVIAVAAGSVRIRDTEQCAKILQELTLKDVWDGVELWTSWMETHEVHLGSVDWLTAWAVGKFMGAKREYLDALNKLPH